MALLFLTFLAFDFPYFLSDFPNLLWKKFFHQTLESIQNFRLRNYMRKNRAGFPGYFHICTFLIFIDIIKREVQPTKTESDGLI